MAAEFAFVTVDRSKVDQAAAEGDAGAIGVQRALRSLSTQLSGAQVGITVTNLAIGYLAEPAIAELIDGPLEALGVPSGAVRAVSVTIALTLSAGLTMIFGELVPKNLAIARPMQVARRTQLVQRTFTSVNRVPIRVLNGSANALVRRLGLEPQEELRSARSSAELASLAQRSAEHGTLDTETAELMERSVEFGTRTAGEIMTPRVRTVSVEDGDRATHVIDLARQSGHSRFPVLDADTAELMERSVEFGTRTAGEIMTPRVRVHSLDHNDRAEALIELTRRTGNSRFPVLDADDTVVGTVHVKHAVALPVPERSTTRVKHIMVRPIVVPDSIRLD
ncbi:MAG: hemolysin family protein, partial [Nocardioides sp.]